MYRVEHGLSTAPACLSVKGAGRRPWITLYRTRPTNTHTCSSVATGKWAETTRIHPLDCVKTLRYSWLAVRGFARNCAKSRIVGIGYFAIQGRTSMQRSPFLVTLECTSRHGPPADARSRGMLKAGSVSVAHTYAHVRLSFALGTGPCDAPFFSGERAELPRLETVSRIWPFTQGAPRKRSRQASAATKRAPASRAAPHSVPGASQLT